MLRVRGGASARIDGVKALTRAAPVGAEMLGRVAPARRRWRRSDRIWPLPRTAGTRWRAWAVGPSKVN